MEGDGRGRAARTYDRVASVYDVYSALWSGWVGRRRRRLLEHARAEVLEVGVGTGLNLVYYPRDVHVTGIDVSPRMLARARRRAAGLPLEVDLQVADVQELPFDNDRFDTVAAPCVFCSVEDPVRGLRELGRVVRPEGRVLLLEHVRPRNPVLGWLADLISPLTRWLFSPEVNRRTERNVEVARLEIVSLRREGVWREIEARPASRAGG